MEESIFYYIREYHNGATLCRTSRPTPNIVEKLKLLNKEINAHLSFPIFIIDTFEVICKNSMPKVISVFLNLLLAIEISK